MSNDKDGSPNRHHFYKPKRASVVTLTGFHDMQSLEDAFNASARLEEANKHPVVAAVESGSSSFVVAICEVSPDGDTVLHRQEFDNNEPAKTMAECTQFLMKYKPDDGYHALGILSSSPTSAWANVDLLTPLQEVCQGTLPLKIKVETTSAVGLAQSALAGENFFQSVDDNIVKACVLGALAGAIGTALVFTLVTKK